MYAGRGAFEKIHCRFENSILDFPKSSSSTVFFIDTAEIAPGKGNFWWQQLFVHEFCSHMPYHWDNLLMEPFRYTPHVLFHTLVIL